MSEYLGFIKSVMKVARVDFSELDLRSRRLTVSTGYAGQWLGYDKKEFQDYASRLFVDLIHPEDLAVSKRRFYELKQSREGEIVEVINRYRCKDGSYIWGYSRLMITFRSSSGAPRRMIAVSEDITEIMNLQEELAIRMAQLDVISYRNSHELRGPVASIMGLLHLMEYQELVDDHAKEIIRRLQASVKKLESVVNGITSVSNRYTVMEDNRS